MANAFLAPYRFLVNLLSGVTKPVAFSHPITVTRGNSLLLPQWFQETVRPVLAQAVVLIDLMAYQAEVGAGKSFSPHSLSNSRTFLSGSI